MKQVLQHARTGEIAVEEVPAPQLLPGCVLVRIAASVVSAGTERASSEFAKKNLLQKARSRPDLVRDVIAKVQRDGILSAIQTVRSRLDQPQTPGYSSSGTVLAVGEGVTDIEPGDRVACAGANYAVHAEIACVPRLLVAGVPDYGEVSLDEAAFATLGAVALHGIRTAEAKLGDIVGVIGLGLMGQITAQLLKAAGCRVVGLDIDSSRADLAKTLGADEATASTSQFRDLCAGMSGGAGVDSVLITAETPSSNPVNLAGDVARDRAIVVAVGTVGIHIERKAYYEKELDFRISRSYGPGRYDAVYEQKGRDYPIGYVRWTETRNMEAFLQIVAEKKVNVGALITHRFAIENARQAYELITGRLREPFLGVVIQYSGDGDASRSLSLVEERPSSREWQSGPSTAVAVGLLGAGSFASSTLIPAMQGSSETKLVTICAANGSHAQQSARKFQFGNCSTDASALMQDSGVNTVVIATRHHLHAKQVIAALQAGKNVFCEKPLCLSEDELYSVAHAYLQNNGPKLMVGFNRRFAPMSVRMRSFLQQISEPLSLHYRINAGYLPPDHWVNDREQGGGRIIGEVCHFVDLLMFLAGSPIVEVGARRVGASPRYSGDNVLISIRFANGSEGTISYLANGDRSFSKERIEVFGGGAAAVLEDFRHLELVRNGRRERSRSRRRQDKGHREEWAVFADSVLQNANSPIPFDEIICTTLATFRIEDALSTGARVAVNTPDFIEAVRRSSTDQNGENE
jgi:predicted dehydrogenase